MKDGYETYDCAVTEGECMIVEGDDEGRPEITIGDENHQIIVKSEDIPRLIAQLTAVQVPDEATESNELRRLAGILESLVQFFPGFAGSYELLALQIGDILRISKKGFVDGTVKHSVHTLAEADQLVAKLKFDDIADAYSRATADKYRETPEAIRGGKKLPTEDTMEVRIAVVTSRDHWPGFDGPSYAAYQDSSCFNEVEKATDMVIDNTPTKLSWVTARVPLPPKPVVHEVEGKVEVSDGS